ncbi:hypothetical protein KC19_8G165100 [Ceratodon purpureus]|uniref:Nucleolar protein 10 n=1 Tax=Ceratodon purpureus TaxID=3225 RepID=A0A8T0H4N2_CERPU|nr:hypothetical protein KC19_8G165100 [Ceratodon purpureus]
MCYTKENGEEVYTLKMHSPTEEPFQSAHPAQFSLVDKFSKHRVICNLLPTQQPPHIY